MQKILKELQKNEAIASQYLESCYKLRKLVEEEVSTSPQAKHLQAVADAVLAKRRNRQHRVFNLKSKPYA